MASSEGKLYPANITCHHLPIIWDKTPQSQLRVHCLCFLLTRQSQFRQHQEVRLQALNPGLSGSSHIAAVQQLVGPFDVAVDVAHPRGEL